MIETHQQPVDGSVETLDAFGSLKQSLNDVGALEIIRGPGRGGGELIKAYRGIPLVDSLQGSVYCQQHMRNIVNLRGRQTHATQQLASQRAQAFGIQLIGHAETEPRQACVHDVDLNQLQRGLRALCRDLLDHSRLCGVSRSKNAPKANTIWALDPSNDTPNVRRGRSDASALRDLGDWKDPVGTIAVLNHSRVELGAARNGLGPSLGLFTTVASLPFARGFNPTGNLTGSQEPSEADMGV